MERGSTQKKNKKFQGRSKEVSCFACIEKGHYRKDCPYMRKGKEVMASIAVNHPSDMDSDDSIGGEVLSVSRLQVEDSWILDTGATFHMSPHKRLFDEYRQMSGTVYLGDGRSSSVDGIGSIRLRMGDGVTQTIRCWHVPGIKRSLISLSTLDSHGYRYHARRGALTVCRSSRTAMRGDLIRGQYLLRGSAIAEKATAVGSESCVHHHALLWQRQLCQRSETELRDRDRGLLGASSQDGSGHVMTLRDVYFLTV